jgi:hypothetical protein
MVVCSLVPSRAAQADSFYFRPCVGVLSETRMDNNSNPISAATWSVRRRAWPLNFRGEVPDRS